MGMTIDKTIEFYNGLECYTPQAKDARDVAIETMRKYQKITEIMFELNGDFYGSYLKDRQALEKIYEVLEDGTIIYKPHCSKCGAIINQQVTYRTILEKFTKDLYYNKFVVIEPYTCACCGEIFETIEIPMPKENNKNDDN